MSRTSCSASHSPHHFLARSVCVRLVLAKALRSEDRGLHHSLTLFPTPCLDFLRQQLAEVVLPSASSVCGLHLRSPHTLIGDALVAILSHPSGFGYSCVAGAGRPSRFSFFAYQQVYLTTFILGRCSRCKKTWRTPLRCNDTKLSKMLLFPLFLRGLNVLCQEGLPN